MRRVLKMNPMMCEEKKEVHFSVDFDTDATTCIEDESDDVFQMSNENI